MRDINSKFTYTLEEFDTTAPYEYICGIPDPFQQGVEERKLNEYAKSVGFTSFRTALKQYRESLKESLGYIGEQNITQFDHQKMELSTGDWVADDSGIWKYGSYGSELACSHPIMPIERLRNIDTDELKIRLAFRRGNNQTRRWTEILTDFDTVSNTRNIVNLSRLGVSVTSGTRAQNLVDYLRDVMDANYDIIPETKSVSRMGWNKEGFAPYIDSVRFDGSEDFARTCRAIHPEGSFFDWLAEAISARQFSTTARTVLASSFASALVEPLGVLPFFVHLWGMDSGTGKTVCQMLAASVWADPTVGGDYFKTFKTTSVGTEVMAGFLNSLPLILDELQLAKDSRGQVRFNVYELASGSGKTRSTKSLGLAHTPTWANCFITSGETPLVGEHDGAGALARVIEVECTAHNQVIKDGHKTANTLKLHYGYAGKTFIQKLCQPGMVEKTKELYEQYYAECIKSDTVSKQAMAAATILVADHLATEWIFADDNALTVADMSQFLKSNAAISAAQRGYNHMCDWVSVNAVKFSQDPVGDIYGVIENGYAYIIRSVWNAECAKQGFSGQALLSHLKTNELIRTRGRAYTRPKKINGLPTECVVMELPDDIFEEIDDDSDPDFPEHWREV